MVRPRKSTNVLEILRLRLEGSSWPQIARRTGLGQGTVYRAYHKAIAALQPFQNAKAAVLRTVTDDGSGASPTTSPAVPKP
ncbi:MAG TPA: helix-turn-helix domain-containing protein [Acidobacteriaceae bacterium]|nr:helix-turn-helix domain-containing protein [Acidobacteriaceae bacterium]